MERGLIRHFYRRTHAEQILVTFGLAIVIQELVKAFFGANPIPVSAPAALTGSADVGAWLGLGSGVIYPWWRLIYLAFSVAIIGAVFAVPAVHHLGHGGAGGDGATARPSASSASTSSAASPWSSASPPSSPGVAGVMYTPIVPPSYSMGMDFLVLSFVVVVVGGMGSVGGAVLAGFLLGILQSFAAMNEVKSIVPGIDQVIIYLIAVVVLLTRPRGLIGRRGVMET